VRGSTLIAWKSGRASPRATSPPGAPMKARIKITLKNGVLDPQGKAIEGALASLGFSGVGDVRQGKYIEVDLAETDEAKAKLAIDKMCKELLANTVIENYSYELSR
jgi:phosphoribosylformylglycinamidine synthase subunit PurS